MSKLDKIFNCNEVTRDEIIFLLQLSSLDEIAAIFTHADQIRKKYLGDEIHLRGIIKFSNYCTSNCIYCSLREDNFTLRRYRMSPDEILESAKILCNNGIKTIILQSGEDGFYDTDIISYIIYSIKREHDVALTLSIGERGFEEYKAWKIAGADRYILRYETTDAGLYSHFHDHAKHGDQINHLRYLRRADYQVGIGNVIGLPMQKIENIADDILFYKKHEPDMIAIMPFIPSPITQFSHHSPVSLELILKTIAITRIVLKNVHVFAVTALDHLEKDGREKALLAGANAVMPNFTPSPYAGYSDGNRIKKGNYDDVLKNFKQLKTRIESIGRYISPTRGDSLKKSRESTQA